MTDLTKPRDAMSYFGITDVEDLEQLVVDYDMDVEVDDDGFLVGLNPDDFKEVLFEEHRKKIGHRPDDPEHVAKAKQDLADKEEREKVRRKERKAKLHTRVLKRGKK